MRRPSKKCSCPLTSKGGGSKPGFSSPEPIKSTEGSIFMDELKSSPQTMCPVSALIYEVHPEYPKSIKKHLNFTQRLMLKSGRGELTPKFLKRSDQLYMKTRLPCIKDKNASSDISNIYVYNNQYQCCSICNIILYVCEYMCVAHNFASASMPSCTFGNTAIHFICKTSFWLYRTLPCQIFVRCTQDMGHGTLFGQAPHIQRLQSSLQLPRFDSPGSPLLQVIPPALCLLVSCLSQCSC